MLHAHAGSARAMQTISALAALSIPISAVAELSICHNGATFGMVRPPGNLLNTIPATYNGMSGILLMHYMGAAQITNKAVDGQVALTL